jgi:hypothetical protein
MGEMVGINFIFWIWFWLLKCDPGVTWMWNMYSARRPLSPLILYGPPNFFGLRISPMRTETIGRISISKISKWNQRDSDRKWCPFLIIYFYFEWVVMALSHGLKYEMSVFHCQFFYCFWWIPLEMGWNPKIGQHNPKEICLEHLEKKFNPNPTSR